MPDVIYIVDTSTLIDLKQYPNDIFKTLWANLEKLVNSTHLCSPKEVLEELKKIDDDIFKWAKKNKKMFKGLTVEQVKQARDVVNAFPALIDINKETPDADPFIIALAIQSEKNSQSTLFPNKIIVVTQEKYKNNKVNIPYVCNNYKIEYIDFFELCRREKWKF